MKAQLPKDDSAQARWAGAEVHLANGRLSMKEMAVRLGFHSAFHLPRAFRKVDGCPPHGLATEVAEGEVVVVIEIVRVAGALRCASPERKTARGAGCFADRLENPVEAIHARNGLALVAAEDHIDRSGF